ncbi:MAG: hypothetical protein WC661_16105 [Opitutaceae bacterium]|jgi:hypothetical protein
MNKQDTGAHAALNDWRKLAALTLVVLGGPGLFLPSANALTGTINGNAADGQANSDGTVSNTTGTYGRLGADTGIRHSVVYVFQIPSAVLNDPTQQFSSATYTIKIGTHSPMTVNGDLYGLGYSTSPGISGADFYEGALDANSVLLKDNFITPTAPDYSPLSESGAALVGHLNDCLTAARASGATNAYVFIRTSLDAYIWAGVYLLAMTDGGGWSVPTLAYNTVTVPAWNSVPLGGGGYVTGLASDAAGDTIYCRTDVGGAFRWSPTGDANGNGAWVSLTDTMVPYGTAGAGKLMMVASIGVDPSNANQLYVGAGSVYAPELRGIFSSPDKGLTWTQINSTIRMDGNNGSYRDRGERLAVDPNNSNIVWFGSSLDGLQKGVKTGATWTWTQIPAASVPFGLAYAGVTFVVCDKNNGNTIVYAGVHDATAGGIYKSENGGVSWSKVAGAALTTPRRAQIASNGTLYVTGGSVAAKLLRGGTLTLMSSLPAGQTYNGVAVDPTDATGQKVYVASSSSANISRSSDGGGTWITQTTTFNEGPATSTNHARKEPDDTSCVTGYWFGTTSSLLVNPSNANELWLGDLFGVSRTRNAQSLGTNPGSWWYTLQKGQEETVVLALKNAPSGAKLLSGLSDVGGFRYADTTVRPYGPGGGRFGNPGDGNNTSLDFSEGSPGVWARAWVNVYQTAGTGAVSSDGGTNWVTFGQLAAKTVTNSATAGWETFDIGSYLQQQQALGKASVTLVVRASHWLVNNAYLHFSSKEGANPPQVVLNGVTTLTPTADAMVAAFGTNNNYGNGTELQAQNYYDQDNYVRWSYLKFTLAGQPAITSATLRLYRLAAADTNAFPTTIQATPNINWIEGNGGSDNLPAGEITWGNKPVDLTANPAALTRGGGRIAVSATNANNLVWLGIKNGTTSLPAYYSKDRGVTWTASTGGPGTQITGIYTDGFSTAPSGQPLAADRGNNYFYRGYFGGAAHVIYRSGDYGATWAQVSTVSNGNSYNMRTPQLVAAPVSPACPSGGDVWLCDDGTFNGSGGGLWRSTNSAVNWSAIAGIGQVTAVGFGKHPTGTGYTVFINGYKGTVKGVYRSDDYGASWVQLPTPTINGILSLTGDRQNAGRVFIGTDGRGVFQSQ